MSRVIGLFMRGKGYSVSRSSNSADSPTAGQVAFGDSGAMPIAATQPNWSCSADTRLPRSDDEAQRRFERYRNIDPYPDIDPALLNSADIVKYVCTTGMVYPFYSDAEHLSGASYQVQIKGKVLYWDKNGNHQERDLDEPGKSFELEPNSIAFITLEPMFRVPNYIALRHNLKIKHIYKGLLLGTGPLVDPGFQGHLAIPLHNLTSNSHTFQYGDTLIDVEFTKMSKNSSWAASVTNAADLVEAEYIPTEIPENRNVAESMFDEHWQSIIRTGCEALSPML